MEEVPDGVYKGIIVWGYGLGTEDLGVTMLLTVEAMKFRAFVVWMARGGSFTGGTTMMGTVGAEVFNGSVCEALSQNDWAQVTGSYGNGDGRGYNSWGMGMIIHACGW